MNGLEQKWREEYRAVPACKRMLAENEALLHRHCNRKLQEFLKETAQVHGQERVCRVLAATINQNYWDGRYCRAVKEWAAQVEPFPQFPGHWGKTRDLDEFCINEHPVIINEAVRLLLKQDKELSGPKRKEPER